MCGAKAGVSALRRSPPFMYMYSYVQYTCMYTSKYIFTAVLRTNKQGFPPCRTAPRRCFFFFRNHTVRCGTVRCGAVRCGAVRCGAVRIMFFKNRTVRCGEDNIFQNHMVRCGAVFLLNGAVRCGLCFSRIARCSAARCGYPLNSCFLRCG